ncbi:MAG: response regulator [Myxococcota bacterium]|nr:response regulator [Myxococcota bacterium]
MAPATILIVDDDRRFTRVVKRQLKRAGHEAVSLSSGQEALEWLGEKHADLLLLDFRLEDMTADELVHTLEERQLQTDFIVITAFGDERQAVEMMKKGARDYLMKDSSLLELLPVVVSQALERARQERRLAETEASLRQLELAVSHARDGVAILTAGEKPEFVYTNTAFRQLTGHRSSDLSGGLERLHGEEGPLDELRTQFAAGESFRGRLPLGTANNEVLLDTQLTPIRDTSGALTHFIAIQRDITHQALLEERIQNAQKMEAIGQLAGGVAHDFNNILTVILGHIGLMRHNSEMPRRFYDALDLVEQSTLHGSQLTAHLLAFSRKQVLHPTLVDLNTLVEQTDRMLSRVLGDGIILRAQTAPEPMNILADAGEIQRALINLAVNARDAMSDGGTLTISTTLLSSLPGESDGVPYVHLVIEDTGDGMSEEVRARIFEPFYTTKPQGKGTGLGLSTVYGIVQQSRGLIQVESTPGLGTRFLIYIPQARSESTTTDAPDSVGTIMIAEDDDMVRQLIRLSLEQAGYRLQENSNGSAALEQLLSHSEQPDLLITDVRMPGMSGTELAQRARVAFPKLPILLISGYTGTENSTLEFELLPKPFTANALLERVQAILGGQP